MITVDPYQTIEQEFTCSHEHTKVVRFTQRNGVAIVRRQCQRCGAQVGSNLPKAEHNIATLPEWDESVSKRWQQERSAKYQAIYEQKRAAENAEWHRQYAAYLKSDQWQRVRKAVLARDNYTCQNCFRKVTPNIYLVDTRAEVHHKSYDGLNRVGESFAFECITLCHACHRRFHGQDRGEDE